MLKILPISFLLFFLTVFLFKTVSKNTVFAQNATGSAIQSNNDQYTFLENILPTIDKNLTPQEKKAYCQSVSANFKNLSKYSLQNLLDMTTRVTNISDEGMLFYNKTLRNDSQLDNFDSLVSDIVFKQHVIDDNVKTATKIINGFTCDNKSQIRSLKTLILQMTKDYDDYKDSVRALLIKIKDNYNKQSNNLGQKAMETITSTPSAK